MSKLSRKDKYKDLRQSIEQNGSQPAQRPARSSRMAAPDTKAERKEPISEGKPVIEDLLGEVREYNLNNGEIAAEDQQLQILHDLSAKQQADARRSEHLEVMEPHEDEGGTTRNLFGSDLSAIMAASSKAPASPASSAAPVKQASSSEPETVLKADEQVDPDHLDLFTPGQKQVQVVEEEVEEVSEVSGRSRPSLFGRKKTARKPRPPKPAPEDTLDSLFETSEIFTPDLSDEQAVQEVIIEENDDQDYFDDRPKKTRNKPKKQPAFDGGGKDESSNPPASRTAMIFMVVCCVVLVILIVLTIYWMSKLGIF